MAKSKAVGIDLGTTYSAMAWINESNKSTLVPNEEGDLVTPSVVLFEDKGVVVGKEAKKVAVLSPDRVAAYVKRDMGKPIYTKPIRGKYLPPEVIQSYILKKLKDDMGRVIGTDFRTIITVPAYFDEPRRKATYQAGELAGLKVLDIVNEPTAAALAYGEDLGYLTKFGAPKERMNVIVYDLGGGTFDVTLIDMQAGNLKTLATDGDVQLGGHDWDMRLVDYMAEVFMREHQQDPRQSPHGLQRMLLAAEEAKHTLSARSKVVVPLTHEGRACDVTITRELFEERTADLLERTRYTTRQLLATAGLDWKKIGKILLTGGSARMPMVPRMLRELSGMEPEMSINPDEAVARGAAVYANYVLASKGETGHAPTFDVTNVNAHSLGVEGVDQKTLRKRNKILIKRNSPLPAKKVEECVTRQVNQHSVVVQVLEGESLDPSECSPIGRTVIRDLPPDLPQGWPVQVTYEYGVNGRLNVRAKVQGTDREVSLELEREESMSADRLNRWKKHVADAAGLDEFDLAIQQELEGLKQPKPPGGPLRPIIAGPPPSAAGAPMSPAAGRSGIGLSPSPAPAGGATTTLAPAAGPKSPSRPVIVGPAGGKQPSASVTAQAAAAAAVGPAIRSQPTTMSGAAVADSSTPGWLAPILYGVMALLILVLGYWLLSYAMPAANFLKLPLPGVAAPATSDKAPKESKLPDDAVRSRP